jgi:hypothetical protein
MHTCRTCWNACTKGRRIGVEGQPAAGGGFALGDEGAGLASRHKAQIFEAVDRQMRKWIIVTPAEAGPRGMVETLASLDSRFRGNDGGEVTIDVSTLSPVPMR